MNWKFWKKKKIKKLKDKKYTFPCSICVVRSACDYSKPCDKLEMDNNKIMELFSKYNCCIDCGGKSFMEGPSGGAATNIKCNGCGHWFNVALPLFIHRIHTP